jgi:hypothetical protein
MIDEISLSILADTDLPIETDISARIPSIVSSSQKFLRCTKDVNPRPMENHQRELTPGINNLDPTTILTSLMNYLIELRKQQIEQRKEFVKEVKNLKLPPYKEFFSTNSAIP